MIGIRQRVKKSETRPSKEMLGPFTLLMFWKRKRPGTRTYLVLRRKTEKEKYLEKGDIWFAESKLNCKLEKEKDLSERGGKCHNGRTDIVKIGLELWAEKKFWAQIPSFIVFLILVIG